MLRRRVVVPNGRVTIYLYPHHRKRKENIKHKTSSFFLFFFLCVFLLLFFLFCLKIAHFIFRYSWRHGGKYTFYFVSVNANERLLNLKDLSLESLTLNTQSQKHWGSINQPWQFVLLSLQHPIAACVRVGLNYFQFHGTHRLRSQNPASQRRAPLVKCELHVFTTQSQKSS